MNYVKKTLKKGKIVIFIMILSLILTLINLIWPLNNIVNSLIGLLSIGFYSFILGIKEGFKSNEKGLITGVKIGLINVLIFYLLSLLFLSYRITLKKIIYYVIIFITTILGSVIGKNKKN